jgi:c-di-AMP phosphodiesterase-like protein
MPNSKLTNPFKESVNLYLVFIGILVGVIAYYNPIFGLAGLFLLAGLIFYNWFNNRIRSRKWRKYVENLSTNIDSAARYAVFNLPVPLVVVDLDGKINWYNSKFTDLVEEKSVIGKSIDKLISGLTLEQLKSSEPIEGIKVTDRYYDVYTNIVGLDEENPENVIIMLYWFDNTAYTNLQTKYDDEKIVISLINVDNYDDVMNETKEEKIPFVTSEIEKKIIPDNL